MDWPPNHSAFTTQYSVLAPATTCGDPSTCRSCRSPGKIAIGRLVPWLRMGEEMGIEEAVALKLYEEGKGWQGQGRFTTEKSQVPSQHVWLREISRFSFRKECHKMCQAAGKLNHSTSAGTEPGCLIIIRIQIQSKYLEYAHHIRP